MRECVLHPSNRNDLGEYFNDANLTVGRYLCFTRGDFDKGVAMLAKGSDDALKTLASADIAKPTTSDAQKGLGDQWWDLSLKEAKNPAVAENCRGRAGFWYLQALPKLTGLAKTAVENPMRTAKRRDVIFMR